MKQISKIKLLDTWNSLNRFTQNSNLFPNKRPTNFKNCAAKLIYFNVGKHFQDSFNDSRVVYETYSEPYHKCFGEIIRFSNATISFYHNLTFETYYYLQNGDFDISIDVILQTEYQSANMNYGFSIFIQGSDKLIWYVLMGLPFPNWQGLLRAFSKEFWILVIITHFVIFGLHILLQNLDKCNRKSNNDIVVPFLCTFLIKTNSSLILTILLLILFYYMEIYTAYRSLLVGFLVNPGRRNPISNWKELEKSTADIASFINKSLPRATDGIPIIGSDFMGREVQRVDVNDLNRLVCKGDLAMIATDSIVKFVLSFKEFIRCNPVRRILYKRSYIS